VEAHHAPSSSNDFTTRTSSINHLFIQSFTPAAAQAYWGLLAATVLAGACSSLGSLGAAVSVEREWPKVLCGSNTAALSKINSGKFTISSSQLLGSTLTYLVSNCTTDEAPTAAQGLLIQSCQLL
jgi:hypothetical protein